MFSKSRITLLFVLIMLNSMILASDEIKALWITPWDMDTEAKILQIIEKSVEWGITDLLVEVRYRADALYTPNRVDNSYANPERRSYMLRNRDFDPLDFFIQKTKDKRIRIHAWVTVNVITVRTESLIPQTHLYNTKPEWLTYTSSGRRINFTDFEGAYIDPGHDAVPPYLVNVFSDIVKNYDVYGLHLDYIRYPSAEYGYNPRSVERYNRESAQLGINTFQDWKEYNINELVRQIGQSVKSIKPNLVFSAAVMPSVSAARTRYAQNWYYWLDEKLIDEVFLMHYTTNNDNFRNALRNIPEKYRHQVIVGLRAWSDDGTYRMQSIQDKLPLVPRDYRGICFFSYGGIVARNYQTAVRNADFRSLAIFRNRNFATALLTYTPLRPGASSSTNIPFQPNSTSPPVPPPQPAHSVEGYVYGFNNQPLRGAKITSSYDPNVYTYTDANGHFFINTSTALDRNFICTYMNNRQAMQAKSNTMLIFNLSVFPTQLFDFHFKAASSDRGIFLFWESINSTVSLYRKSLAFKDNFTLIGNFDSNINFYYDQSINTQEAYEYQLVRNSNNSTFIYRPRPRYEQPWDFELSYKNENIRLEIINKNLSQGHWSLQDLQSNTIFEGFLDKKIENIIIPNSYLPNRFLILSYTVNNRLHTLLVDLMSIKESL